MKRHPPRSTLFPSRRSSDLSPEIEFREGDAEALPFPEASFDAVVMNFGMLHLAHPERAVAEAFRVLSAGGRFAFTVDRKSTRLNSSHGYISYAVFCLKQKKL